MCVYSFAASFFQYNREQSSMIVHHFYSMKKAFVNLFTCRHPNK